MKRIMLSAISILLIAFITACGDFSGVKSNAHRQTVGPEGGTVTDPEGAVVVIPPGALSNSMTVSVETFKTEETFNGRFGTTPLIGGAEFGPDGTVFSKPVTITMPLFKTLDPAKRYIIWTFNKGKKKWEPLDKENGGVPSADGKSITYQTTHFSGNAAGEWEQGMIKDLGNLLMNSNCDSEYAVNLDIINFMNKWRDNLFAEKRIIDGQTWMPCGILFDFMINCNGADTEVKRMIGNESDHRTSFSYSYDLMKEGGGSKQVITIKDITIYWCPRDPSGSSGSIFLWPRIVCMGRNLCEKPLIPGMPGYMWLTSITVPTDITPGHAITYSRCPGTTNCPPLYSQLNDPELEKCINCMPWTGNLVFGCVCSCGGPIEHIEELRFHAGHNVTLHVFTYLCSDYCHCTVNTFLYYALPGQQSGSSIGASIRSIAGSRTALFIAIGAAVISAGAIAGTLIYRRRKKGE